VHRALLTRVADVDLSLESSSKLPISRSTTYRLMRELGVTDDCEVIDCRDDVTKQLVLSPQNNRQK
jgi:hypothetical protein